jgi:hypothetical protein
VTDTPDNDARLTRYLLGEVSEHERQAIERECFRADGEAFAELVALEDELRVAYAQRRLSAADRVAFERKYLTTVSDRARLAFAQALSTMADREPAVGRGVAAMPVRWWRRPAVTIGLAAATVVLGLATGALVLSNQRLRHDLAQRPNSPAPDLQPVVAITLLPGLTRSAGSQIPRVSAADAARGLRLSLTLPDDASPASSYTAVLLDVDGRELHAVGGLQRRDRLVPPGDYQVTLRAITGGGRAQDLSDYYLRIVAR